MSAYINTETLAYPVFEGEIRLAYPNTSFPAEFVPPDGYAAVQETPRPATDYTQNLNEGQPAQVEGVWTQTWEVTPASAEEIASRTEARAVDVRAARNRLLTACDWTQLADAPVDSAAWSAYRQALRDITQQPGFPWAVDWPAQP